MFATPELSITSSMTSFSNCWWKCLLLQYWEYHTLIHSFHICLSLSAKYSTTCDLFLFVVSLLSFRNIQAWWGQKSADGYRSRVFFLEVSRYDGGNKSGEDGYRSRVFVFPRKDLCAISRLLRDKERADQRIASCSSDNEGALDDTYTDEQLQLHDS